MNATKLKEHGLAYIEISLDSVNPKKHDEFREMEGAWDLTLQGIKNCLEAGIYVAIATVFTKDTLNEVDPMLDLAAELGTKIYSL